MLIKKLKNKFKKASLVDKIAQNAFGELLFHMGFELHMIWFLFINKYPYSFYSMSGAVHLSPLAF